MVVHPQLLQSDRQWHQSIATCALLASVLWIGSLDRKETNALAVSEPSDTKVAGPNLPLGAASQALIPKTVIVKDRELLMRLYAGVDKEGR
jgi:hypothetical protein